MMPPGEQGDEITIGNALAAAVTLWPNPNVNGKIAGAAASVSLAPYTITTYRCVGFNSWIQMVQVTASALPSAVGTSRPVGGLIMPCSPVVDPSCRAGGAR